MFALFALTPFALCGQPLAPLSALAAPLPSL